MNIHIPNDQDALSVSGVYKRFHIERPSLWQRIFGKTDEPSSNGHASANGHGKPEPKSREVIAVNNVSLEVKRNEIYGILGPNGSGKSTLVRLLSTLLVPDEGQVRVFGLDITQHEMAVKRLINRVSVDAAFFKKLSPMENLLYGARLYGKSGREAHREALDILERLGLQKRSYYEPMEEMSRGMQQKVAIARAFLTQPILLLLDEPTTGLDPRAKFEVQAFVNDLRDNHDATILITTHDMGEADSICDRIAILDEGLIVAEDTPEGLKNLVRDHHDAPTLEDVFMELTGKELVEKDAFDLETAQAEAFGEKRSTQELEAEIAA